MNFSDFDDDHEIQENEESSSLNNSVNNKENGHQINNINQTILVHMEQVARNNIENGQIEKAFENFDNCIEHLLNIVEEPSYSSVFQEFLDRTVNYLNDVSLKILQNGKSRDSLRILDKCIALTNPDKYGASP